jgi:hypothetical protein
MLLRVRVALVASMLFLAPLAGAATLDLTGLTGAAIASGYAGTVTYAGNAAFGPVTFSANPAGSDLTWSAGNGFGINCPITVRGCLIDSAYEIDAPEVLSISFATPVLLTSIDIGMLSTTGISYLRVVDQGSVVGSDFTIGFSAAGARHGQLTLDINRVVTSVSFVPQGREWRDFTLARIRIADGTGPVGTSNPIPEPSSVLLALIGGGIVASQIRARC